METRNNLDLQRAIFSEKLISEKCKSRKLKQDFKRISEKLPMMIRANGLGATIAFFTSKTKSDSAEEILLNALKKWIVYERQFATLRNDDLLQTIIYLDRYTYKVITVDVLLLCDWLKRISKALIND